MVTMMNYNHDTQEIARPSEVLARVQSYMASLRTLELYVNIDITRVLTAVLLQETQPLDSKGESNHRLHLHQLVSVCMHLTIVQGLIFSRK